LLRVKAEVISECQQVVRDQVYGTTKDISTDLLKYKDERSFVIEPLLGIKPRETQEKIITTLPKATELDCELTAV
jgi:hypothetical protein